MIEPYLIESSLSSLFDFLNKKVISTPADRAKFDFIIKNENGRKTAIEVKGHNVTVKTLFNIESALHDYKDIDELYLITPEEPTRILAEKLKSIFKDHKTLIHWMGIQLTLEQFLLM